MRTISFKLTIAVLAFLFSFTASQAFSQSSSPSTLVRGLYRTHDYDLKHNRDTILSGKNRKVLTKYFDKRLTDYIWRDLTTHVDEVGVLDFDPFYNSQDPQISNFKIGTGKIAGRTASVSVSFKNADRSETLVYSLVKENAVWKISDIKYEENHTLLKYFKEDEGSH